MSATLNSTILNKAAINTNSGGLISINAVIFIPLGYYGKAAKINTITADIAFDFDIDGASSRHAAKADLEFGFESSFAASRLKVAQPEAMAIAFDMLGDANKRGIIEASMAIDLTVTDKMQFAHLHRAQQKRVMIMQAEVRSSTIEREQQ